jgi:5-methylcytosine-specific restriction protein A
MPEAARQRNQDWSRDELILALDLYLQNRSHIPDKDHGTVTALSAFLRKMAGTKVSASYRNPNSVHMKLANLRSLDPQFIAQGKKGLPKGGKGDALVWAEFAAKPDELRAAAAAIRAVVAAYPDIATIEEDDDIAEAPEGRLLTRAHVRRERNRKLVQKKKEAAIKAYGGLKCEACGFTYKSMYGARGEHFIEVHHLRPLKDLLPESKTKLTDLALLCANCHRMVHARTPWLTLPQLLAIIAVSRG